MLSVAQAVPDSAYYNGADNYYAKDDAAPSFWFGKAAAALGLKSRVDNAAYACLCYGMLPDGTTLGRVAKGERQHAPGWDLTFSAPKSVSLMALVGGDRRLVAAVNEAAKEAMAWVEEHAAQGRFANEGETINRPTNNIAAAMFPHDLTRAKDPGLHVHAVVMNATQGPDGKWRGLHERSFYWFAKEAGLRFQQSLALRVRALGYEIEADTVKGTFEIAGVPRRLIEAFSTRAAQIDANLAAKGLTRETSTKAQREAAAIQTRNKKDEAIDRRELASVWRQVPGRHGVDLGAIRAAASMKANHGGYRQNLEHGASDDALKATRIAARILAEKSITFSDVALLDLAARHALGRADRNVIRGTIRKLDRDGFLHTRETQRFDRAAGEHIAVQGWTTAEAMAIEASMLRHEHEGRSTQPAILSLAATHRIIDRALVEAAHWEEDHRQALFGLLQSADRVVAVDGSIASPSARQVIGAYLNVARQRGFRVRLMTPSAAGATALANLMDRDATTVAGHLAELKQQDRETWIAGLMAFVGGHRREVWVVTDAARLRPAATRDLLDAAEAQNARVVLMDRRHEGQAFGSKAFEQLVTSGIAIFRLPGRDGPDIDQMHLAVAALARGEPAIALGHIEKAGGQIVTIAPKSRSIDDQNAALEQRRAYIADRYVGLSAEERDATRVLDLTHRGKDAINQAIRKRLLGQGEIGGPSVTVQVLIARPLSPTERKQALSYGMGDIIRFASSHRRPGQPEIVKGDYLEVREVHPERGVVILGKDDGRLVEWQPERWGAARAAAYRIGERDVTVGERIVWTRKDVTIGVANQQRDVVVGVDPERAVISIERHGRVQEIDLSRARHLDHAYAETARSRAAVPAERVIAHLPVDNVELTNLQAVIDIALQAQNHLTIVTENSARLAQAVEDRPGRTPAALDGPSAVSGAALDAVRSAADILVERNAVFAHQELTRIGIQQGLGLTTAGEIESAIDALARGGQLIAREARVLDYETRSFVPGRGWTTLAAIQDEERMLDAEKRGRFAFVDQPILRPRDAIRVADAAADSAPIDRPWNGAQWTATVGLLSSPHAVTGLQGFAGTAKTNSVLATLAGAARGEGHDVAAMAPTTDAALTLGKAIGAEGRTVARHLSRVSRVRPSGADKAPVWIVDEASMISAKTMRDLVRAAEQHGARLFLVFDVLQLGSVGAGRAAGQLIEHGMHTHYLDAIVRQAAEPRLAEAVYDLIRREPGRALQQLEAGGGRILEIDGDNVISGERARHQAMAREYVGRPPAYRDASLVIDPTREGVDSVSRLIREELTKRGELSGSAIKATMLQDAGLTRTERATATSYKPGQIVRFMQTARLRDQPDIASGAYLTVEAVEGADVRLRDNADRRIRWEPRSETYPVSVFEPKEKELRIGDRIRWTENNDTIGAVSGRFAKIVAVDANSQRIEIEHSDGRRHQLDLARNEHRHLHYGYAVTIQRAQGATAYPILNAPSYRVNTIHLTSAYVGVSRAPGSPFVVTDNRNRLIRSLGDRVGLQSAALDQARETAGLAEQIVRDLAAQRHRSADMQPAAEIQRVFERGRRSIER